jgi:AcrR family transcriptional regulator
MARVIKRKRRMSRGKTAVDGGLEEQRRRQLVAAVVECMSQEGFERTTTRNIADRAGVSIGMLHYYFASKKELVVEAIRQANDGVMRALSEADTIPFGPRRLEFILRRTMTNEYPQALPLAFRLAVTAAAVNEPNLQEEVSRWMEDGRAKFERSIRAGIAEGTYRSDIDPQLLSVMLYGAMTGLAVQAAVSTERVPIDLAVEAMLQLLQLFEDKPAVSQRRGKTREKTPVNVQDSLESSLLADPNLSAHKAMALSEAFKSLYRSFSERGGPK